MSNILILNQSYVNVGLGTLTFTIPADGLYNVRGDVTENPISTLTVVVNQNGSPKYTAPGVTPTQSAFQFKTQPLVCTAGDAITIVISSAADIDNQKNTVKSIFSIGQGA